MNSDSSNLPNLSTSPTPSVSPDSSVSPNSPTSPPVSPNSLPKSAVYSPAIKLSPVRFIPHLFALYKKSGTLAWEADGTISLSLDTGQTLFSVRATDIARFFYLPNWTIIKLRDGRMFRFVINLKYRRALYSNAAAGVVHDISHSNDQILDRAVLSKVRFLASIAQIYYQFKMIQSDEDTDGVWWAATLGSFGVKITRITTLMITLWAIVITFAIGIVLLLISSRNW